MPKLVDHVDYRRQLLAQCLDLFARQGYGALTMRQIAEALNVSTGTLYHYFPTKEALFQQLVAEVTQQTLFEAKALVLPHTTLEERLFALFAFIALHEDDLRKQFAIILNYYQHRDLYGSDAGAILQEGVHRYRQAIKERLGLADPQLCFLLQSQIYGFLLLRMLNGEEVPFQEQARLFIDMLIEHIRSKTDFPE